MARALTNIAIHGRSSSPRAPPPRRPGKVERQSNDCRSGAGPPSEGQTALAGLAERVGEEP
eukprot:7828722-Pyramimonas_sp.AAC.1